MPASRCSASARRAEAVTGKPLLLSAPDKFRGSLSGAQFSAAAARSAEAAGWAHAEVRLSDGGEGFGELASQQAPPRFEAVSGPLGEEVVATWWLGERGGVRRAVIESQLACGLTLAGGREGNDPLAATTAGVGQLIGAALSAGAEEILVGCGGSASTDGGRGALRALGLFPPPTDSPLGEARLLVACDVTVPYLEAASRFGPQKGASDEQVAELRKRLESLAATFAVAGHQVTELPGSGAAGGLAGGLAALGAELVSGFGLVAELVGLEAEMAEATAVVTGEGHLDEASFEGKVVGGVVEMASRLAKPVLCIAGGADKGGRAAGESRGAEVVVLSELYGAVASLRETERLVSQVCSEWLGGLQA